MDVFDLRDNLISDYGKYVRSFIRIKDARVKARVDEELDAGALWPSPLVQINPSFVPGESVSELVASGILHPECNRIFRVKSDADLAGRPLRFYKHQAEAIKIASERENYVLTTGTGSGKSLAYIVPIVDHVLRNGPGKGIQAIIVYPMNALANSQWGELKKFLSLGYPDGKGPVTFARYTGQEKDSERQNIIANPPDILLTNYVMLELLLTRPDEKPLIASARGLRFLVLDEIHTYRGRQGADVAMLVRRARDAFDAQDMQCVGTSATLASGGSYQEQQAEVARVASLIFGDTVKPQHVIGESLRRATPEEDVESQGFIQSLRVRILNPIVHESFESFIQDPLSIWIESTLGVKTESGRLVRQQPRPLSGDEGVARELSEATGVSQDDCAKRLAEHLLGSYAFTHPETGLPVFAFRLHQFISRGDAVYASIEPEDKRYLTLQGQQFVPGDRERVLLPLVFCRECGQEYYATFKTKDENTGRIRYLPRDLGDREPEETGEPGFLYLSSERPWPTDAAEQDALLPEEWFEYKKGSLVRKKDRTRLLPQPVSVRPDGLEGADGTVGQFVPAPFRFCLHCGVSYEMRQSSDFGKLTSLATEGRSTATTVLSLSAIRYLRSVTDLPERARKLLSFTDNRQDASLQAGHFNDFVRIGLLRSALYKAVEHSGPNGPTHDTLVQAVFDSLGLPIETYAVDPQVQFLALEETKRALRSVLGYWIYRDLMHGWRVTLPNLEQAGLLEIQYLSLSDLSRAEEIWGKCHPALSTASPEVRFSVAKTLLDMMRRDLAIKVDYLDPVTQERILQQSSQRLVPPWALDESEGRRMETSKVLYLGKRRPGDTTNIYLTSRSGFSLYLRRPQTFPDYTDRLTSQDSDQIVADLFAALKKAGLVEALGHGQGRESDLPAYQLPASALRWVVGSGKPFHDPIRVPRPSSEGGQPNAFFSEFYRSVARDILGIEAREHTAQVRPEVRQEREELFREGKLPILYCSPTMELGVDISELNLVNMRNIPPTPANYAQRSGRAGRSGQPALVFSYCSTFSSHDQYFFRRPERMVGGAVTPPRLDMTNEDLVRAHVNAIWLAETGLSLGSTLKDILDLSGDDPSLELLDRVKDAVSDPLARKRAEARANRVLQTIKDELLTSSWYSDGWLPGVLAQAGLALDRACDRWRSLYRAALAQRKAQHAIISDASRSAIEKGKAKRLRAEAESQIELLTEAESAIEADFYSYRYFASEGFLPGYSFPRLPLSAYIPGERDRNGRNEFLSRPRFLAISEFGPRAIVYHEGSQYRINKVILPVSGEDNDLVTTSAKQCSACGYLHPIASGAGPDLCERCGQRLGQPLTSLFRLQNVSTRRADRISSDEEERMRIGYEIRTAVRFADHGQRASSRSGRVIVDGEAVLDLTYGSAATLWRINLGWKRRANRDQHGFVLDIERGYWARNNQDAEDEDDQLSQRTRRVIPYVEDRRNCLLVKPVEALDQPIMASLQAALKNAIQVEYQLEDTELAAEPLPSRDDRQLLLFYEAAEGGAGVLRRLLDDPHALARVARRALQLCHFDPDTGEDKRRAERSREDCEAACYDCLMSYTNQQDHAQLDRQEVKPVLERLARSYVEASPVESSRAEHLASLKRQSQSSLEKAWLDYLEERGLRLPSRAQVLLPECNTRPDFMYDDGLVAIYVDGPVHKYPDRQERDKAAVECMEDMGFTVLRFASEDEWDDMIATYASLFGRTS